MRTTVILAIIACFASCADCGANNGARPDAGNDPADDGAPDIRVPADDGVADLPLFVDSDLTEQPTDLGPPPPILGSDVPSRAQPGVSADGVSDLAPVPGEARAGRFADGNTGFTGLWAHCKAGDVKLFNGRIEACISGVRSNRHELFTGGSLVDIRPTGDTNDEVFDILMPRIEFNTVHADEVSVLRDGTDGGPAVVRMVGEDFPIAYLVGVVGERIFRKRGFQVVTEYRLGPDADFIEIATFVTSTLEGDFDFVQGDLFALGDRGQYFQRGEGFGVTSGDYRATLSMGPDYAFAWFSPRTDVVNTLGGFDVPWQFPATDYVTVAPGETSLFRSRLLVAPTLDAALTRVSEELEQSLDGAPRTIRVVDGAGEPVAGRTVVAYQDQFALTAGRTAADGTVTLTLPDGDVRFTVTEVPGAPPFDQTATVADTVDLTVATPGTIRLSATDGNGPLVAGAWLSNGTTTHRVAIGPNGAVVDVAPGTWEVSVGRGPEWNGTTQSVQVTAGEELPVTSTLVRAIDTTDWIAADFHQHMEPSPDSEVHLENRVWQNVAMGLELITPTDHDVVTDLVPVIADLDLGDWVSTFSGVEISPTVAHVNVYPLPWQHDAPGRGSVPLQFLNEDGEWKQRRIPELIALARQLPTDPVIQLNHPRDSGFFRYTDFDPLTGPDAVEHPRWTTDFDAVELMNGDECQVLHDLAGLWNAGLRPTAIGSTDTHGEWGAIGAKRTYVRLPGVAANAITPEGVRDAIKANQAILATWAFIEFTDATLPGDTIVAQSGVPLEVPLRVQTPDWASVDTIQMIANGEVRATLTITPGSANVDWDDSLQASFTEDTWVSFIASGPRPTGPWVPGNDITWAFTNPIFVDVGGDGWQAPGPRPLDLSSTPYCVE